MVATDTISRELKKLAHHSSHYAVGLVASLALGFVSFPIFTRIFSVADYGAIDFIGKILLLMTALSKAGLQQAALRFYDGSRFAADREAARRYYSTLFLGIIATAGCVSVLFLISSEIVPGALAGVPIAGLAWLAAALIVLRSAQSVSWVFLRVEERTRTYNVATVALKAATVVAICALLPLLGRSVFTYFSGTVIAELAIAALLVWRIARQGVLGVGAVDGALFRSAIVFGLPLIVYELAGIVLDAGDRVLVRHYLGAVPLGYYSVAYGLSSYVNDLLIAPVNLALVPIYIRLWATAGRQQTVEFLSRALDLFAMLAAGLYAVIVVAGRDAVIVLASTKYSQSARLLPYLVAGLLIYTAHAFVGAGLMIHKNTLQMAKLVGYSAVFNVALNCLLLPRIGLEGAAIATLLSYLLYVVLLGRAAAKVLPLSIDWPAIGRYLAAAAVTWAVASQVELGPPVLNMVVRSAAAAACYIGAIYALDARARSAVALGWKWFAARRAGAVISIGK